MEHNTAQEQISQFLDDELPKEELQPMFMHLGECDECRGFFVRSNSIRDTAKQMRYMPFPDQIDQKFSVLGMNNTQTSLLKRTFTISVPSAMLSVLLVFMISIVIVSFIGELQSKIQYTGQKTEVDNFKPTTIQVFYYN